MPGLYELPLSSFPMHVLGGDQLLQVQELLHLDVIVLTKTVLGRFFITLNDLIDQPVSERVLIPVAVSAEVFDMHVTDVHCVDDFFIVLELIFIVIDPLLALLLVGDLPFLRLLQFAEEVEQILLVGLYDSIVANVILYKHILLQVHPLLRFDLISDAVPQ